MGAALSTLIAYVFLALIMYVVNQRIYPIPFEIHIFAIALLVGIAFYAGSSFLAQHQTIYGVCAIYVGSTVLYGGCLVLLEAVRKGPGSQLGGIHQAKKLLDKRGRSRKRGGK